MLHIGGRPNHQTDELTGQIVSIVSIG